MARRVVACLFVALQMACGGGATAPSEPSCRTSWSISGQQDISLGERAVWQAPMTSTCLIGGGWTLPVRWRSSNPSIAEVAIVDTTCQGGTCPQAVITGRAAGTATIVATNPSDNSEKSAQITVAAVPVVPPSQIIISLPIKAVPATQQFTIHALGNWPSGPRDVTFLGDWSSSNENVATVSAGNVRGLRGGTTVIRVSYSGVSDEMPLLVLDPSKDGLAVASLTETTALIAYVLQSTLQGDLSIEARDERGFSSASRGQTIGRGAALETMLLPQLPPRDDVKMICLTLRLRPFGGETISVDGGCRAR
jgi:hypothetical protein